ncbi:MAG: DegT/DnrJ/EryC1/StrS family aminotransferase [Planctomycetes bacterium]|nr:DegT/DnrJ/EryC1/StrS family aminotransferase [Planctomycetota bacterium]
MSLLHWYYPRPANQVDWGLAECAASVRRIAGGGDALVERAVAMLRERCGAREVLGFERGRSALRFLLEWARALPGARGRRRVLVPALLCKAVPDAVLAAGLEPVLCDVTADLTMDVASARAALDPAATLALVVPHVYGWPSPVAAFEALAAPHDIVAIDDAAAALGGLGTDGRALGTGGDAGLFSFSQGKPAVAGGGGVCVLPPGGAFAAADALRPAIAPASRRSAARGFRRFLWQDLLHRFSGPLGRAWAIGAARLGRSGGGGAAAGVELRGMAGLYGGPLLAQLRRLELLAARRRRTAELLAAELAGIDGLRVVPWPAHATPTRFVVECRDLAVRRDAQGIRAENPLAAHLRRHGTEARYAYPPLHRYRGFEGFAATDLSTTERLADRALLLPLFGAPSPRAIARIGRAVRSFFGA